VLGPGEHCLVRTTLRGTARDGVFVGLWQERAHGRHLLDGGFDGAYTCVQLYHTGARTFTHAALPTAFPEP
jgi:hypothetical protein